jgi:hypothetical protein
MPERLSSAHAAFCLAGAVRAGAQRIDEQLDGARRRDGGPVPLLEREVEQRGDRALLRHGVGAPQQWHERRDDARHAYQLADVRPVLRRILATGGFLAEEAFLAGAWRPGCWCCRLQFLPTHTPPPRRPPPVYSPPAAVAQESAGMEQGVSTDCR